MAPRVAVLPWATKRASTSSTLRLNLSSLGIVSDKAALVGRWSEAMPEPVDNGHLLGVVVVVVVVVAADDTSPVDDLRLVAAASDRHCMEAGSMKRVFVPPQRGRTNIDLNLGLRLFW